ncbi:MAG: hypothetical protein JWP29_141 [Rhodoferax sp.]|nr:hypothetical protein [Rhodoferax sp.]
MQIEVNIDDELLAVARSYVSAKMPLKALLLLALKTYVRVQKTKRLSALGGAVSDPQDVLDDVPSATSGSPQCLRADTTLEKARCTIGSRVPARRSSR